MKYVVTEQIKHPSNLATTDLASFSNHIDAIEYCKFKAKQRASYDKQTPFKYSVGDNQKELHSNSLNWK